MSTRSTIGILNLSGQVKSIYCHSDGYPEGVGYTLVAHYNTLDQAKALVAMGDCSFLGDTLGEQHVLFSEPEDYTGSGFYHRDRGTAWKETKPAFSRSVAQCVKNQMQAYLYLWITREACWKMLDDDAMDRDTLVLIPGAPYLYCRPRTRHVPRRPIMLEGS